MSIKILFRRGSELEWFNKNPVLASGEPGLETDTLKVKYGDGVTPWNSLAYASNGDGESEGGEGGAEMLCCTVRVRAVTGNNYYYCYSIPSHPIDRIG